MGILHQMVAVWQVGGSNSLMVINLPYVMKFTIISASQGVAQQDELDFSMNFEVN